MHKKKANAAMNVIGMAFDKGIVAQSTIKAPNPINRYGVSEMAPVKRRVIGKEIA